MQKLLPQHTCHTQYLIIRIRRPILALHSGEIKLGVRELADGHTIHRPVGLVEVQGLVVTVGDRVEVDGIEVARHYYQGGIGLMIR